MARDRRKRDRQLADEAYRRSEQMQIQIHEGNVDLDSVRVLPKLDNIPSACPQCQYPWRADAGLVPLIRADAERQTVFLEQAQCGGCGAIFLIEPDDHEKIRVARAEYTARQRALNTPLPKPARGKRERGAG